MNPALVVAIITASVTLVGWLVTHILTIYRDSRNQKLAASLKYVERQLEELYGPLAFLILEGRRTFKDLMEALGRDYIFDENDFISEEDLKVWLFWVENDFFPRNEKIQQLIMAKTHLIQGDKMSTSFLRFLEHHNSWKIDHLRWQKEGVKYSWHSKINWPQDFEEEIINTFSALKKRHNKFLMEVTEIRAHHVKSPNA